MKDCPDLSGDGGWRWLKGKPAVKKAGTTDCLRKLEQLPGKARAVAVARQVVIPRGPEGEPRYLCLSGVPVPVFHGNNALS
jgi:hypothetical protein